jgi:hypothetical protein
MVIVEGEEAAWEDIAKYGIVAPNGSAPIASSAANLKSSAAARRWLYGMATLAVVLSLDKLS